MNKKVKFDEMTVMHKRVWDNLDTVLNNKFTATKDDVIDVLKANPYHLGFMSYFMDSLCNDFSEDACEIVSQIIKNLKSLIELLLPLASVPMFAGDNDFIDLKNYLFDCEKIYELIQLNIIQSALDDIADALGGEL